MRSVSPNSRPQRHDGKRRSTPQRRTNRKRLPIASRPAVVGARAFSGVHRLRYNPCREVIDRQLEQYFDFLAPDDIRIKGHRIGIESVLYEYLFREQTAEQILRRFPSLTLEQVYATILYYLSNREKVEAYIRDWLEWGERMRTEQDRNLPPVVVRLRALKAQQQKAQMTA